MMESSSIFEDRDNLNEFLEEAELQQYYELFRDILKVTKVSQLKFVLTEDLTQIGLSRPEQRRYKKIYSKYFPNPYISKIRKMLKSNKKRDQIPGHTSIALDTQPVFENNVKVPTKHIISIEDITINKELGMGQFGVVQLGTWTTGNQRLQVAIKCLGHERMTSNSTEFLKEAAVMHSIEHPNIVRLYGVVLHLDSLMLVTELAPLRSLLECLREVSFRLNFPVPNLCEFAEQICDGMTYLESKRLIHRDLAARNILVFSKDRVKISDFGLSRALGVGKDYYQTNYNVNLKLPVAWCAPECILFLRFTSASDVWAFGVCLWEMFTYGFQPWAAFSGQQILEAIDSPNFQRLERPECCPEAYYAAMLECWAHDFNNRPKFKELGPKLRSIRPEQVQASVNSQKPEDGRRNSFLEYKNGQIITILGKESMTKSPLWYGVLPGGACGMFDPTHTKPYTPEKHVAFVTGTISPNSYRQSARPLRSPLRSPLQRTDVTRHTFSSKRTQIQRSMISSPQGDVKHMSHVGLDGAYFGDISFLDPAGRPRLAYVLPYKPSEDLEQMPLINPNSPSHLTGGASGTTPYHMLTSKPDNRPDFDGIDVSGDGHARSLVRNDHWSLSEPSTSTGITDKARSGTLSRPQMWDAGAAPKADEVHEYHEISDTDMEGNAPSARPDRLVARAESVDVLKSEEFSQSLIQQLETMFQKLDMKRNDEPTQPLRQPEPSTSAQSSTGAKKKKPRILTDSAYSLVESDPPTAQTLSKAERKKGFSTSTMKPMSASEEKTLDTAVAMANEITAKSMSDLDGDKKFPQSPSEKSKFFKFPSRHHHGHANEPADKDHTSAKKVIKNKLKAMAICGAGTREPRRNFSEEANSVQDIQSTLTEESKMAYTSLIEEPTPSTSLMSHIAQESSGAMKPSTMPKPARMSNQPAFHSLQHPHLKTRVLAEPTHEEVEFASNVLPLPPRTSKPKLVDMPRHVRKYPLKMISQPKPQKEQIKMEVILPIIYQNTKSEPKTEEATACPDVVDGPKLDTNPFNNLEESSSPNPFNGFFMKENDTDEVGVQTNIESSDSSDAESNRALRALVKEHKDHVSVEDLLEFADQKPCGRQRGKESDEVRVMLKVLKDKANQAECLEALELSGWNVHNAIKLVRVKVSVGTEVTFDKCHEQLQKTNGDIMKAVAMLVSIDHT